MCHTPLPRFSLCTCTLSPLSIAYMTTFYNMFYAFDASMFSLHFVRNDKNKDNQSINQSVNPCLSLRMRYGTFVLVDDITIYMHVFET